MKFSSLIFYSFCLYSVLSIGLSVSLRAQTVLSNNYVVRFDPHELEGKWFEVMGNSPLSGKKTYLGSTFGFACGKDRIEEEETWQRDGHLISREGSAVFTAPAEFTWKPRKGCHPSRTWNVVAMDDNKQWIIVYYPRKFLAPAFILVLCRKPDLNAAEKERIAKRFGENYFLQAKTRKMRTYTPGHA